MPDGTLYSVIHGSDWGWKDAPGIGLTRKRVAQSFQLQYHPLFHPKTQRNIPLTEVILD